MVTESRSLHSPLHDLVRLRRSIRVFSDEAVPRSLVEGILRDALWAPSPHNSQPWRFTALFEPEDKRELASDMAAQLAAELLADGLGEDAIERQTGRSWRRISTAPVVILCSLEGDGLVEYPDARRNALEWQMAVQSVGAILQTVFLLAATHGVGSCWMAAPMYCPNVVRATLNLPERYEPQALVLLGYPAAPGKERDRRDSREVVDIR
jgi:coenzyme F420-0:L-glutamate ligase/coenzyme F420-1:gamma-L-glutamate ligase